MAGRVKREEVKTDALYNLGNSRFQEGKLEAAADAYRKVLRRDSSFQDARHNLGLTTALLAEAQPEEEQPDESGNKGPKDPKGSDDTKPKSDDNGPDLK